MIRGLAAIIVCIGHLRGFFLVDYEQTHGGSAAKLFYAVTGLHHAAVMIFFVLSGFLVGGSIVRAQRAGTWRWGPYLLRRLCRLWVVIVPALVLTLFWDRLGAHFDPRGYAGAWYLNLLSGPTAGYSLSPATLLGNIAFLQTVAVSVYGSNSPLWSLANEFWYYILFPLALQLVVGPGGLRSRGVAAFLLALLVWVLPMAILLYGVIWLFGVVAFLLLDRPAVARIAASLPVFALAAVALVATMLASRVKLGWGNDFTIGLAFMLALPWLARAQVANHWYRVGAFAVSELSYTLYLVHFPLLAWLYFLFAAPAQLPFTPANIGLLAIILLGVIAYSAAIWWLFERNTDRVRHAVVRAWQRRTRATALA